MVQWSATAAARFYNPVNWMWTLQTTNRLTVANIVRLSSKASQKMGIITSRPCPHCHKKFNQPWLAYEWRFNQTRRVDKRTQDCPLALSWQDSPEMGIRFSGIQFQHHFSPSSLQRSPVYCVLKCLLGVILRSRLPFLAMFRLEKQLCSTHCSVTSTVKSQ